MPQRWKTSRGVRAMAGGLALLTAAGGAAGQPDPVVLQGSEAVIQIFSERDGSAGVGSPYALLKREIAAYAAGAGELPPDQAAEQWVRLVDRYLSQPLPNLKTEGAEARLPFSRLLAALPPPSAWEPLAARIEAKWPSVGPRKPQDVYWRMFARLLRGEREAVWEDLLLLRGLLNGAGRREKQEITSVITEISRVLIEETGNTTRVLQAVELLLGLPPVDGERCPVVLPDLVSLVGEQRARAFLRRILTTYPVRLYAPRGEATRRLAQRIALEEIARLKAPQWSLSTTLDNLALFPALEGRFGRTPLAVKGGKPAVEAREDRDRALARAAYVFALATAGRPEAAAARVRTLRGALRGEVANGWVQAARLAGKADPMRKFLRLSLAADPGLPLWDAYVELAAREERFGEAIALMQAQVAHPALSREARGQIRERLIDAELATGREAEAIAELKAILSGKSANEPSTTGRAARRLVRLGLLVERKEWVDEGAHAASELAASDDLTGEEIRELAALLEEAGRARRAEEILLGQLELKLRDPLSRQDGDFSAWLVELAGLFHRSGRHRDVLRLLDEAPGWNAEDLGEILHWPDQRGTSLGYMAAAALASEGKAEAAASILRALLRRRPGYDPAYELLVRLEGGKALPFLDALAEIDRFEERPLIWKATVLGKAGRLPEAEEAARAAIAADPSDEDAAPGYRLRAYEVLANILEARKDPVRAGEMRVRVRAMRQSEQSDAAAQLGLTRYAVEVARNAVRMAPDLSCARGKLALLLIGQGDSAGARPYLVEVAAAMPAQQGSGPSLCRSCEALVREPLWAEAAQEALAESVVPPGLAASRQLVLGLAGELRGDLSQALRHIEYATGVAPDSLLAWTRLARLAQWVRLPRNDRDGIGLALARLDPLERHFSRALEEVADLRQVWQAAEAALRKRPRREVEALYPLPASAASLRRIEKANPWLRRDRSEPPRSFLPFYPEVFPVDFNDLEELTTPGDQVARDPLVRAVAAGFRQKP